MPRLGNTTMNFPFNPNMPYFAAPPVPPNIRMYNEMMMRGNMRNNSNNNNNNNNRGRNGPSYNQQSTGNSMYLNPAFFEQQQQ
jgi:hypothetical protein